MLDLDKIQEDLVIDTIADKCGVSSEQATEHIKRFRRAVAYASVLKEQFSEIGMFKDVELNDNQDFSLECVTYAIGYIAAGIDDKESREKFVEVAIDAMVFASGRILGCDVDAEL